ncbi:54S ribosomal protein L38, mitochondrial [Rhodotorula kratochvilovae]
MLGLKATMSIIDNSGALVAECVNVLKTKTGHGMARIGDEIVVVIKRARPNPLNAQGGNSGGAAGGAPKVRRGDVRRAVVVRTKYPTRRPDGRYVRFDDNAAVLVNNKKEMIGNRIGGVVAAELRSRGWGKIVSLAPKVV